MAYVIGVDVGGTFTDAVLDDDAGTVLAAKSPSTPPDYSRGVLDVLELLAEQLGSLDAGDARRHPPHRPRHHVVAERAGHGQRAAGRVPHHQGPPRLDLHHERRGPLPRAGRRTSCRTSSARPRTTRLLPKRHALEVTERIDRDGTVVVALDEDAGPRGDPRRCSTTGSARSRSRCCGRSATRRTSGGCAS